MSHRLLTYRGLMTSSTQEQLRLRSIKGENGYRIVKFELMPNNYNVSDEYTIQVWKTDQTGAIDNVQDFSDNRLLAAGYIATDSSDITTDSTVIFDREIFNQDIFVTAKSQSGNTCNYYLELELMPLDLNEATVATLKNMRNLSTPG